MKDSISRDLLPTFKDDEELVEKRPIQADHDEDDEVDFVASDMGEEEPELHGVHGEVLFPHDGDDSGGQEPTLDETQAGGVTTANAQLEVQVLRRSDRIRRPPPGLMEAYDVELHGQPRDETITTYPMSNHVNYDQFSPSHRAYFAAITKETEPKSFAEAVKHACWREAMQKEIAALVANGTWTLESLTSGLKAIGAKWVYKIKYRADGSVERYKARLVAKGFTQLEGVDFHDTYAPVAKIVTVRVLLSVAVKRGWDLHQLDVNNAFLYGDLEEEVYMQIPQGFGSPGDNRVCRLRKSIYGLKQASRNWYHKFTASLSELGFKPSRADHSLLIYRRGDAFMEALIYVDDVILTGNDTVFINHVKKFLDERFSIKDLGSLKYFLGIEVARLADGLVLNQRKYTLDILSDAGVTGARPSGFPMEQNHNLTRPSDDILADVKGYRRLVGRLLYLTVNRPDISYAVNILSQFVHRPGPDHVAAAVRVLRYLKNSPGQGLFFLEKGDLELTVYCDTDWAGCQATRRSTTGYYIQLGGPPVSWSTKKQKMVSRSSAEAEYRAMASTVSDVLWL
ncbi:unnamed protein product [Linum trigynum]|uniref:Reverse transcriptase Ty1/copia-type domain-containing protein n=1 Tax=Linum trigynum TaxID=586398 RepID=A0AAV2DD67_9ROSI